MAKLPVDIDRVEQLGVRRRARPDDASCAGGVQFGNVRVNIEDCICSVCFDSYELSPDLRKADLYVTQQPIKVTVPGPRVRNAVAFVGVRSTTAHELYVALLHLSQGKLTLEAYTARIAELVEAERRWQDRRVDTTQDKRASADDEASK